MQMRLDATLLSEGTSDRVLVPIIERLLDLYSPIPYLVTFAESIPSGPLDVRVALACENYPCQLLFVHRDVDRDKVENREAEITRAVERSTHSGAIIKVVPVRMTEAWLLVDAQAIRRAAGNPAGRVRLALPSINRIEAVPDPKSLLQGLLAKASELGPTRLRRFDLNRARRQVGGFMTEFDSLRLLPSFAHMEAQIKKYFSK